MKLVKHISIIQTCKSIAGTCSFLLSGLLILLLAVFNIPVSVLSVSMLFLSIVLIGFGIFSYGVPVSDCNWTKLSCILAKCGLISYITIWYILQDGDVIDFEYHKYTGDSDDPQITKCEFWEVQLKGTNYIRVSYGNDSVNCLTPQEFVDSFGRTRDKYNVIKINKEIVYSNIESVAPKAKWIIY